MVHVPLVGIHPTSIDERGVNSAPIHGVIEPSVVDPGVPMDLRFGTDISVPLQQEPSSFITAPGQVDFSIQQTPEIPLNSFDLDSAQGQHGHAHGIHSSHHSVGDERGTPHNSEHVEHQEKHTHTQHSEADNVVHHSQHGEDNHVVHHNQHNEADHVVHDGHQNQVDHVAHDVTHNQANHDVQHTQTDHIEHDGKHIHADHDEHSTQHTQSAHEDHTTAHQIEHEGKETREQTDLLPPAIRLESAEQLDTTYGNTIDTTYGNANANPLVDPTLNPDAVSAAYDEQIRKIAEETIRELDDHKEALQDYTDKLAQTRQADQAQNNNYQQLLADRKETAEQLDADYRLSLQEQQRKLEEDRLRREEEEKLRKQEEDIRRLSDTMLTAMTTTRQQELDERVRAERLREDQQRREEDIRQDTKQETYIVKPKDTLESITKKKLGSLELVPLVYELNKTKVQVKYASNGTPLYIVKAGTVLHLPSRKQVREYRQRKLSQSANNLRASAVPGSPESQVDDSRRANIENMLGPISVSNHSDVVRYTVRLGDSLRSVAMKHPALNDVSLWKLVARKNGLPTTTDSKGVPMAMLRRGSEIVIPSQTEIAQYRLTMTGENLAAMQPKNDSGVRTELATTQCPSCMRLVTASSTVCPACAFPIASGEVVVVVDGHTRAVSTARVPRVPAIADWDETVHAPATADTGDTTLSFNNSILKFHRAEKDADTSLSFAARRLEFETGNVLSFGPLTGETTLSFERQVPTGVPSARTDEEILESTTEQLSDTCRMVKSVVKRNVSEITRTQLEVLRDSEWAPILAYEVSDANSMRHEYLSNGTKRSIMIDLPASAALEMIQNDLASNWLTYCKKFLAGKRLSA
jgi:hypothetical protein